jgi:putative FmdB family regulatory protein
MSPTYEYKCMKCQETQVLSRNVEDRDDEVECVCGNKSSRIYNTVGVQFKGTGFYSTGG